MKRIVWIASLICAIVFQVASMETTPQQKTKNSRKLAKMLQADKMYDLSTLETILDQGIDPTFTDKGNNLLQILFDYYVPYNDTTVAIIAEKLILQSCGNSHNLSTLWPTDPLARMLRINYFKTASILLKYNIISVSHTLEEYESMITKRNQYPNLNWKTGKEIIAHIKSNHITPRVTG